MKIKWSLIFLVTLCIFMVFPEPYVKTEADGEGYQLGYSNGWIDGIKAAEIDYENRDNKNYLKVMPNSSEITEMYNLEGESSDYITDFISGYEAGFKDGYNMAYDKSNSKKETSLNYAEELGFAMGEIQGYIDFFNGKSNKWTNSVPSTSDINKIFDLTKEADDYKNRFISTFIKNFKEGYENGYRKVKYEPYMDAVEKGAVDGEKLGKIMGANNGKYDYYMGRDNQWTRNLPSDKQIISMFSLSKDYDGYLNAFISAFKKSYRESYEEAIRMARIEYSTFQFEKGYSHGFDIGSIKGKNTAKIDVMKGVGNNVNRYEITDTDIINHYKLFYENDNYERGFISGYREGFKIGYIEEYQKSRYDYFIEMTTVEIVPTSGAQIVSSDKKVYIDIDKGSFYKDVLISIEKIYENSQMVMPLKDRYIRASDIYSIQIVNASENVNNDKNIILSFKYFGKENAGIYKYSDNKWIYMPTTYKIGQDIISTYIKPETINNKVMIFGVFIDNKIINPLDLRGHWAREEIDAYLRRGIVELYEDNTFRPDTPIFRGQAVELINDVFNADLILEGDFDVPMTYKEIEDIMKQIYDADFSWIEIAKKMMWSKDKRSMSLSSMDYYITRAEMIYMLYYLKE